MGNPRSHRAVWSCTSVYRSSKFRCIPLTTPTRHAHLSHGFIDLYYLQQNIFQQIRPQTGSTSESAVAMCHSESMYTALVATRGPRGTALSLLARVGQATNVHLRCKGSNGNQCHPMRTYGNRWGSMSTKRNLWQPTPIYGNLRKPMRIYRTISKHHDVYTRVFLQNSRQSDFTPIPELSWTENST